MQKEEISLSMNMEQPHPGVGDDTEATYTYGLNRKIRKYKRPKLSRRSRT